MKSRRLLQFIACQTCDVQVRKWRKSQTYCSSKCSGIGRRKAGQRIDHEGYIRLHTGVREHVAIAELALGHPLPRKSQVHHFDEDKTNNANTNLVICEDTKYHRLLHIRRKILLKGGNPDTEKPCQLCRTMKPRTEFALCRTIPDGRTNLCKECKRKYDELRRAARRNAA